MAFSLSSYNSSEFNIYTSNYEDLTDFFVTLSPYPGSEFSELSIVLTYSSSNEYYFAIVINGESVPYDFESDFLRISTWSGEGHAFVKFDYPPEVYVKSVSHGLGMEQTLSPYSSVGGGSSVDLSSVLNAITSLDTKLLSKIDSLDLQNPASINGITPIDITDLGGNYCKYVNGEIVYYGAYGLWEVVKSFLALTADNQLTPFYHVRQSIPSTSPVEYRYNTVPQDYLFPYIPENTTDS